LGLVAPNLNILGFQQSKDTQTQRASIVLNSFWIFLVGLVQILIFFATHPLENYLMLKHQVASMVSFSKMK
jgi:hypothetical protein